MPEFLARERTWASISYCASGSVSISRVGWIVRWASTSSDDWSTEIGIGELFQVTVPAASIRRRIGSGGSFGCGGGLVVRCGRSTWIW